MFSLLEFYISITPTVLSIMTISFYKTSLCPNIECIPSICPSVRPSVGPSVCVCVCVSQSTGTKGGNYVRRGNNLKGRDKKENNKNIHKEKDICKGGMWIKREGLKVSFMLLLFTSYKCLSC